MYQNQSAEVPAETVTKRKKRSKSEEFETLKFKDPIDGGIKHLLERRDDIFKPVALNQEPQTLFQSTEAYTQKQLDEYLEFCTFVMRSCPVQGNYCGIWLRGSHMYKEKAFKLLNEYGYNFDLAKFHILYPAIMSDSLKKLQIL